MSGSFTMKMGYIMTAISIEKSTGTNIFAWDPQNPGVKPDFVNFQS